MIIILWQTSETLGSAFKNKSKTQVEETDQLKISRNSSGLFEVSKCQREEISKSKCSLKVLR